MFVRAWASARRKFFCSACGDFDGDGRIGTAEDTDGGDRIFGTINAALGPFTNNLDPNFSTN